MERIINLEIVFQSRASAKARKNIIRRDSIEGPWRNRSVTIATDIRTGPGSGANTGVREMIAETLKRRTKKGELMFYVIAEFERTSGNEIVSKHFKTIAARSEIPVQFRRL